MEFQRVVSVTFLIDGLGSREEGGWINMNNRPNKTVLRLVLMQANLVYKSEYGSLS